MTETHLFGNEYSKCWKNVVQYRGVQEILRKKRFLPVKIAKGVIYFFHIEQMNQISTQVIQLKVHGEILPACQADKW